MNKSILLQKQIRDNAQDLHSFMSDMRSWESEMKRKEAELTGVPYEKELPPVRSKIKKKCKTETTCTIKKKLSGSDYDAWDKFDADKACVEVDEEDIGPTSLDCELSQKEKMEKLREEAHEEKEKGNQHVKLKKWDEAITCYTRAIELVKDNPIYYANRGLCYLKKENLHAAESDCTKALELEPTYVKALQRRVCVRETLGSLRSAAADVKKIIELEPNNIAAKRQLAVLVQKMGTKGPNTKTSPASTPSTEKVLILPSDKTATKTCEKSITNISVTDHQIVTPISKPPHLRSKKALVHIPVIEIPLGCTTPISESIPEKLQNGDCAAINNVANKSLTNIKKVEMKFEEKQKTESNNVAVVKMKSLNIEDKESSLYQVPKSSVQFLSQWKLLNGRDRAKSQYLKLIPPKDLPSIFQNFLESDVLSEILQVLSDGEDFVNVDVGSALEYLENITKVKRFGALTMFLSSNDKKAIVQILKQCLDANKCSEENVQEMKNKFEIEKSVMC